MAEWKQKQRHMNYYNYTAHIYNTRYTEEQNLKIKVAIENLELKRDSSILDLGCGTGLLLPKIQEIAKEIVGLDLSKGMLKEVKQFIRHSTNIHFVLADADHTPLRHDYFDMAFAITLLQNMPNPHQALNEIKRVTKLNSSIIITILKKQLTEQFFLNLLRKAELKPRIQKTDDNLKCHIAICRKCSKNSLE